MYRLIVTIIATFLCFLLVIDNAYSNEYSGSFFTENKGQIIDQYGNPASEILYLFNQNGLKLYLKKNGFSYECYRTSDISFPTRANQVVYNNQRQQSFSQQPFQVKSHRIDISFPFANTQPTIITEFPVDGFNHYYTTGTPVEGVSNVRSYRKITYQNIYPKIDIVFYVKEGKCKYEFILHPGARLQDILLVYEGASSIKLKPEGNLEMKTSIGSLEEQIPVSYIIEENGSKKEVNVSYVLTDNKVSFSFPEWKLNTELVIDPLPVLEWGTYYGDYSWGEGITIDNDNNVVAAGLCYGVVNMITVGAHQTVYGGGGQDAYVAKFTEDGVRLWGTIYGGSQYDRIYNGVAVDSDNNIVVGGYTESNNNIATPGAYKTSKADNSDNFVAKFDENGIRLWATYYGGPNQEEYSCDLTVDNNNNIFLLGTTFSTTGIATAGTHQTTLTGGRNCYIASFTPSGNLQWGTYFGNSYIYGWAIASDQNNNIILTGGIDIGFGVASIGAHQTTFGGQTDAFVAKLSPAGTRIWSTYYGGSDYEQGVDITTDLNNNIILCGETQSTNNISTIGAHLAAFSGEYDAFLVKFDPAGNRLWGTYYGNIYWDLSYGVSTDINGNIFMTGETMSSSNIATPGAHKTNAPFPFPDAYVVKFDPAGNRLWGTYYGGDDQHETATNIAVGLDGKAVITGYTASYGGISTPGAFQTNYLGNAFTTFIAKFRDCDIAVPEISANGPLSFCAGGSVTLTSSNADQYLWTGGETTSSITVYTSGSYSVTAQDATGCRINSAQVNVEVFQPIGYSLGPDRTIYCQNETILGSEQSDTKYTWSTGETTPQVKVNQDGLYSVAVDYKDCPTIIDSVEIYFLTLDYKIPNLLTINNDGKNDVLFIEKLVPNTKINVYNGWGNSVYQNDDYKNNWTPTGLSDGIYYYHIELSEPCTKEYKGWIHILR